MYEGPPLLAPEVPEPFQPPNGWMSGHAPVGRPGPAISIDYPALDPLNESIHFLVGAGEYSRG